LTGAGGLPKDYRQVAAWYLEAAHQNDPYAGTAQIILGQIYEEGGYGVLRNYVEAYKWYDIAAAHKFLDTKKGCPIDDPSDSTCAAALQRDLLAVKMTQAQITEAERLSHERRLAANRT
jgi:hypothetical protein